MYCHFYIIFIKLAIHNYNMHACNIRDIWYGVFFPLGHLVCIWGAFIPRILN